MENQLEAVYREDVATVVENNRTPPEAFSRPNLVGQHVGHYRLQRRLGSGGMGEVYLADDLALGRPAAIKLLPQDFSSALRERLLSEARTSARLQHPCIATFFEAGEPDGVAFIAMEFVAGETLRQRLRSGPLAVEQVVSMASCLLEALGHAHALGILHRDIKPENIILTGTRAAKLLDFGIAKELFLFPDGQPVAAVASASSAEGAGAGLVTQAGAVLGTPGYMAPEQLEGLPLDERADLYALGLVLAEALTGRAVHKASTVAERKSAVLTDLPSLLERVTCAPALKNVLSRALAPNRADRFPSAAAFLRELRHIGLKGIEAAVPESMAVLDFENLTGNTEDDWIGIGSADNLRKSLARISSLRLISREQILKMRKRRQESGASTAVTELGLVLGCRWVLSGAFERVDSQLRLQTTLIEVPTSEAAWNEAFEGQPGDLFALQERIATRVGARFHLDPVKVETAEPDLNVYRCYLQGRQAWLRLDKASIHRAQEFFEQAVRLDPRYAPALACLAGMHGLRWSFTMDPAQLEIASGYAQRALQADPNAAEAHLWSGYIQGARDGLSSVATYRCFEKAMELNPSDHMAPYFASGVFSQARRSQEVHALHESLHQQPCPGPPHHWRRTEAVKLLQRAIALNPDVGWAWLGLGAIHLDMANLAAAEWSFQQAHALEARGVEAPPGMPGWIGECLCRAGALDRARAQCLLGLEMVERTDNVYRDTLRGLFLCSLGKTALRQADQAGSQAAFTQALHHLRGRSQARAGGHVMVRALAGLSQAGAGAEPFSEGLEIFRTRQGYRFDFFHGCFNDTTLLELARAAQTLGRTEQARQLLEEAIDQGSLEAAEEKAIAGDW